MLPLKKNDWKDTSGDLLVVSPNITQGLY